MSKTFLGFIAPIMAVVMAFIVSGFIILFFIKSYSINETVLSRLESSGLPDDILKKLRMIWVKETTSKEIFEQNVIAIIGTDAFRLYGGLIKKCAVARENPINVYNEIFKASLKDRNGWGNVLYRATPLIFTGLAVALAFQCGLFNIGGEGQMVIGGFAIAWIGFTITGLPGFVHITLCVIGGALAGGVWGVIPGYLKAKRGVHEVVTTIMLNWIAVALIQYLTMAYKPAESWIPHTFEIAKSAKLSRLWVYLNPMGITFSKSNQVNTALFLAIAVAIFVFFFLNRTKMGYEIRAVGHNPDAAECAGISVPKNTMIAMAVSGAIAGLAGVNQVMGYKFRFRYGIFEGLGFDGIGVAFIGKNSPFGCVLAAVLFGVLDQGGLAIDVSTKVPREIVLVLKATILIFVVVSTEITKRTIKIIQKKEEAQE